MTRKDAVANLRAFSEEFALEYRARPPPYFTQFEPPRDIRINTCLGWMRLPDHVVWSQLGEKTADYANLTRRPWYFALVYTFVPEGTVDEAVVQSHLDFFYLAGFVNVPAKLDNWRGPGILVDFSDLVHPMSKEWDRFMYGRMVKKRNGAYDLETPNRRPAKNRSQP